MTQVVANSIASERVATILVTGFASLAMLLALMGIYSVLSYSVVSRTKDIGIRMALGAQASDVLSLLMKQALALVGIGIANRDCTGLRNLAGADESVARRQPDRSGNVRRHAGLDGNYNDTGEFDSSAAGVAVGSDKGAPAGIVFNGQV
jgi:FtsX-like permease family